MGYSGSSIARKWSQAAFVGVVACGLLAGCGVPHSGFTPGTSVPGNVGNLGKASDGGNTANQGNRNLSPLLSPGPAQQPKQLTVAVPSSPASTVAGVSVTDLPNAPIGAQPIWSPSGNTFAYPTGQQGGTYIIGTLKPFRLDWVSFGEKSTLVAIQDNSAIVTSWSFDHDVIYPITTSSTGEPVVGRGKSWSGSTDAWQEWTITAKGPAIVTGGYKPGSIALTFKDGTSTPLHGGQVYMSGDREFGAVAVRSRGKRTVHPAGDVAIMNENQPSSAADPITIWNFDSKSGPKLMSTLHLPAVELPAKAGSAQLQTISFSPDDKYVAVLVISEYATGPQLHGQTFIFDTKTGKLLGKAPYGNGMTWLPNSSGLYLGTSMPAGQGKDKMANLEGTTLSVWPEGHWLGIVPIAPNKLVTYNWQKRVLQMSGAKTGDSVGPGENASGGSGASSASNAANVATGAPDGGSGSNTAFSHLPPLKNPNGHRLSPNGHAAIAMFDQTVLLFQW